MTLLYFLVSPATIVATLINSIIIGVVTCNSTLIISVLSYLPFSLYCYHAIGWFCIVLINHKSAIVMFNTTITLLLSLLLVRFLVKLLWLLLVVLLAVHSETHFCWWLDVVTILL